LRIVKTILIVSTIIGVIIMAQIIGSRGTARTGSTTPYNPWAGLSIQEIRDLENSKRSSGILPYYGSTEGGSVWGESNAWRQADPVYNFPRTMGSVGAGVNPSGGSGGSVGGSMGGGGGYPEFSVDLAGIWETAGAMADNEINPQLEEIDRLLQEAGYTADESQRAINEAYPIARRSIQKSIYENMVAGEQGLAAMGTGRGGGRQELLARAGEREATGIETLENQKSREIGAIKRALENYKGQLGRQKTSLEGARGRLRAGYAEQLRGNRFNEAAMKHGFDTQRAQLEEQRRQFNASLSGGGSSVFGLGNTGGTYYNLTPDEVSGYFGVNLPALAGRAKRGIPGGRTFTNRSEYGVGYGAY